MIDICGTVHHLCVMFIMCSMCYRGRYQLAAGGRQWKGSGLQLSHAYQTTL